MTALIALARRTLRRLAGRRVGEVLEDLATLPVGSAEILLSKGPIFVLAPHPDDESLGCGGLLALAAQKGTPVRIVFMTDGGGSHPGSFEFPPDKLRSLREREAIEAAAALGFAADTILFLREPDGSLNSLGPEAAGLIAKLTAEARRLGAATILSTWIFDGHPDHVATAVMARSVAKSVGAELYYYPIWGLKLPTTMRLGMFTRPRGWRIDISRVLDKKMAAIACHRSQMTDLIKDSVTLAPSPEVFAAFVQSEELYVKD